MSSELGFKKPTQLLYYSSYRRNNFSEPFEHATMFRKADTFLVSAS